MEWKDLQERNDKFVRTLIGEVIWNYYRNT